MRRRLLLRAGRGAAASSALLPFTGAIRPAGPAAWALLVLAAALMLAGGAGALARYGVSELANTLVGRQYPLGTFVVNVLGCFLFGLIWELAAVRLLISDTVRLIILVGFMGSFTTFSSLIFDSFALGQTRLALLLFNIGAQTILGFAALFLGMTVGKHW